MRYTTGLLALAILFTATAWCQDAERKALEGTWKLMSAEVAGTKLDGLQPGTVVLTIADAKYTVQAGHSVDKGTIKTAAKTKAIDFVGTDGPNKGKTLLAIYEIDRDTLRVCYDLAGRNRPTEFATSKGKPFYLAVYERAR
jgi:uncharacterized protein (TIGR03067 family)